jgi:hypothetical protein
MAGDDALNTLLGAVNDASGVARGVWIAFILFGAYLAVILFATTHEQLLLQSPVNLPILGVDLPLSTFFIVAPGLFLLLHLSLLVQLWLLARKVEAFNGELFKVAQFDDRMAVRHQLDMFPFTQMLTTENKDALPNLLMSLSIWVTVVVGPIFLLLLTQVQYLPMHEVATTWWHRFCLALALGMLWALWPRILRGKAHFHDAAMPFWADFWSYLGLLHQRAHGLLHSWRVLLKSSPDRATQLAASHRQRADHREQAQLIFGRIETPVVLGFASVIALLFSLMVATIPGETADRLLASPWLRFVSAEREAQHCGINRFSETTWREDCLNAVALLTDPIMWIETVERKGRRVWRPTAILFEPTSGREAAQQAIFISRNFYVQTIDLSTDDDEPVRRLRNRDFRFADIQYSNLRNVDFSGSDFTRASLRGSDLRGALLDGAQLTEADLTQANLEKASLPEAISGAKFDVANLRGAAITLPRAAPPRFISADLTGALLMGAWAGQDLRSAKLVAVTFVGADVTGVRWPRNRPGQVGQLALPHLVEVESAVPAPSWPTTTVGSICRAEWEARYACADPFVATIVTERFPSPLDDRSASQSDYFLARWLMQPDCAGALSLSDAAKAKLRRVAQNEQGVPPSCAANQLQPYSSRP